MTVMCQLLVGASQGSEGQSHTICNQDKSAKCTLEDTQYYFFFHRSSIWIQLFKPKTFATLPKPSVLSLHVQTPTFPHRYDRNLGKYVHDRSRVSIECGNCSTFVPAERNQQYDRTPSCRPPTLSGQSGCGKSSLSRNRAEGLLDEYQTVVSSRSMSRSTMRPLIAVWRISGGNVAFWVSVYPSMNQHPCGCHVICIGKADVSFCWTRRLRTAFG